MHTYFIHTCSYVTQNHNKKPIHKVPENLTIWSCKPVQASCYISFSMIHSKQAWHSKPFKSDCTAYSFLNRPSYFAPLVWSLLPLSWMCFLNVFLLSPTIHNYSSFNSVQGLLSGEGPALWKSWSVIPLCFHFSMRTLKHSSLWLCCGLVPLDCRLLEILGCLHWSPNSRCEVYGVALSATIIWWPINE